MTQIDKILIIVGCAYFCWFMCYLILSLMFELPLFPKTIALLKKIEKKLNNTNE